MNNNIALCVITISPNNDMVEFYSTFTGYDVYFIIDNNNFNCKALKEKYPSVYFIQIMHETCDKNGFKHSSYMPGSSLVFPEIISWDKALYYFTSVNPTYEHVWFLEDDVFVYGQETVKRIDDSYPNSDFICRDKTPEPKGDEWQWFWPAISINFSGPYFQSTICAVRMSKQLLQHIKDYIQINQKMFFIEAMFPTIAHKYNLIYDMPKELNKIVWRRDWQLSDLNTTDFFHPIKNYDIQKELRKQI